MALPDPLIGQKLGDYKIESLLGKGGMARVYKGLDENLDRYAAVKVITSEFQATTEEVEYTERFQKEARAIARLRHPHIVGIYQFGQTEGLYYMAMVFLDGDDLRYLLRSYLKKGKRMPIKQILKMASEVADALDHAHSHGVIHRDIKPSNIMMTSRGAVLTDFGLALSTNEGTMGDTFGSAHYIAPEQAVSSARAVPQSDLYSLGIVLYECFTGRVPFDDPSAMSVALKHLNEPPPPLRSVQKELPQGLEDAIEKVLNKDPRQRFRNGKAFVKALYDAVDAKPIEVKKPVEEPVASGGSAIWKDETWEGEVVDGETQDEQKGSALESYLESLRKGSHQKRPSVAENILTDIIREASKPEPPEHREQAPRAAKVEDDPSPSQGVPLTFNNPTEDSTRGRRRLPLVGIVAVILLLLVGGGLFALFGGGDDDNDGNRSVDATPTMSDTELTALAIANLPTATDTQEVLSPTLTEDEPTPTDVEQTETATREEPTLTPTTDEQTASPTDEVEPTATEDDIEPTETRTPRPTTTANDDEPSPTVETTTVVPTETNQATATDFEVVTTPDADPEVRLEWTTRRLRMTNISDRRQNLGHLVFRGDVDGEFESLEWWNLSAVGNEIYSFREEGCVQVVTSSRSVSTTPCRFYNAWLQLDPAIIPFWAGGNESFVVYNRGVPIAECGIEDGACEFAIP
jgi:serine/threonine protein kinase